WAAGALGFRAITPVFDGATDAAIDDALARAWLAIEAGAVAAGINNESAAPWGENLDVPVMEDWLKEHGSDFNKIFDETKEHEDTRACLEIWLNSVGEPPKKKNQSVHDLLAQAEEISNRRRIAPPVSGKQTLFDGRTGEPFDQPVTVGQIYMLKLVHQV